MDNNINLNKLNVSKGNEKEIYPVNFNTIMYWKFENISTELLIHLPLKGKWVM